jgi:hypothetical protein
VETSGVEKFVVLMAKDTHTLSIQERVILPLELLVFLFLQNKQKLQMP